MNTELTEINNELIDLAEKLDRKKRIKEYLIDLENTLNAKETELERLNLEVEKERYDIEKLSKSSIKNLFIKILGNKEEQLEIERQEFLMIVLKYKGVEKEIEGIQFEIKLLSRKLKEKFNLDNRFKDLLNRKREILRGIDKATSTRLKEIEDKILNYYELKTQLAEALEKGKECEKELKQLEIGLRRAKKWGQWYYSGTKHVSESIQKDYIKETSKELFKVNNLLQEFERELNDVYDHFKIDYRKLVDEFTDFLEIFYDRLITDWLVIKKIDNSLNEVSGHYNKIKRIMYMLEEEEKDIERFLKEEEKNRQSILLKIE